MTALITTDPIWWPIVWILFGAFGLGIIWAALSFPIAVAIGRAFRDGQAVLDEQAADHGEPSRTEVEADWWPWMDDRDQVYGQLAMYGPKDEPRPVPLSESETARMVRQLGREVDAWGGESA